MPRFLKRSLWIVSILAVLTVSLLWLWLRSSLPQLDGTLALADLQQNVSIQRDRLGVVTIESPDRLAAAYATGFVHAQDRFFQMDLNRRYAAGELAALFGQSLLAVDRRQRPHQMRQRARQALTAITGQYRDLLDAYTDGVNAGLQALGAQPFEYTLLGATAQPWQSEDSALVLAAMYFRLQSNDARREYQLGWLAGCFSEPVFDFLAPIGTSWDAPLHGPAWPQAAIPGPQQLNIRALPSLPDSPAGPALAMHNDEQLVIGSNNWALMGERSANGAALVADDMHLGLSVPHIWYRLRILSTALNGAPLDINGVSLPGMPFVVVGSNTHIAWGFTNSYGDWLDLIRVEPEAGQPGYYRTPEGSEAFKIETETIQVNGGEAVDIDIRKTRWGPVIEPARSEHADQALMAWRWVAHTDQFFTAPGFLPMEHARRVSDAIELAPLASIPAQNLIVGDRYGDIGWTIMGRIPLRHNSHESRLPLDWRIADRSWPGWLPAADYPVIINPAEGQLWTANNRQTDGRALSVIGYGQVDLGARARQIKTALDNLRQPATVADMHAIQWDQRGLFLARWRDLMLNLLDSSASSPLRQAVYEHLQASGEHAAADAIGYRLVREFRERVKTDLMRSLTRQCAAGGSGFTGTRQAEGPVWKILQQRPMHLLDAGYPDWDSYLLTQLDSLADSPAQLRQRSWGQINPLNMTHPIGRANRLLGWWLNMRPVPMAGDNDMPRVYRTGAGQSQRMAVSPGFEAQGYMVMPAGQSGHPLSPYYRSLHNDWLDGSLTPFLPGPPRHTLTLTTSTQ